MKRLALLTLALLALPVEEAAARGVSPYLPLNLDPEVERQVERVLILADKPILTRPIAVAVVFDALPKACQIDPVLCEHVRKFLNNYMAVSGVQFASFGASASGGLGTNTVIPNQHGAAEGSTYEAAAAGYWQPSDYVLINVGGVAYQGRTSPTGSMLSVGWDWAQLDVGYRDHWWSPMTDSSPLISSESPTMPSVTLSNYDPLWGIGLQYEVFYAKLSYTDKIELIDGSLTAGHPNFGGLHLGIEPASGWSLGLQRIMVWGGGAAGGQTFSQLIQAFFNPAKAQAQNTSAVPVLGKQEASVSSNFIFPGRVPFSIYFDYAANDTSDGKNYLFGKPILSAGVHIPHVGPFDITYEGSTWAPTWYVHSHTDVQTGYGDGITNYLLSTGHWFGDQRQFKDAVGGRSNALRVGWEPPFGGLFELEYRMLVNDSFYSAIPYYHENMGSLSYAHPWKEYAVGAQIEAGRNVFGQTYWQLTGFLRYGDALRTSNPESPEDIFSAQRAQGAELHLDAGVTANQILENITVVQPQIHTSTAYGAHALFGARRAVSRHQDLGADVGFDDIAGHALFSVRALDYRYRFNAPFALNLFLGAARYELGTPAFGWYLGLGAQWRNFLPGWDIGLEGSYGANVARVRTLPSDPQGGYRPDAFYDIYMGTLYIAYKF